MEIAGRVDQGIASRDDISLRNESWKILGDLDRSDAKDMAQKAKVKWAKSGDENTNFYTVLQEKLQGMVPFSLLRIHLKESGHPVTCIRL